MSNVTLSKLERQKIMANEAVLEECQNREAKAALFVHKAEERIKQEADRKARADKLREETEFKLHDLIHSVHEFAEVLPEVVKGESKTTLQQEIDRLRGRAAEIDKALRAGK